MKKTEEAVQTVETAPSYGYYSHVLKKPFNTVAELQEAEKAYEIAHAEELKAAEVRKTRAKEIEAAYKNVVDVRSAAAKKVEEAKVEASKMVREAEEAYTKLRDEFIKDYGSFHMSYTNSNGKEDVSVSDLLDRFLNNPFTFWF